MRRVWKADGPDYVTGSKVFGGEAAWMHNDTWRAYAWDHDLMFEFKRRFKSLDSARRAIERWLDHRMALRLS